MDGAVVPDAMTAVDGSAVDAGVQVGTTDSLGINHPNLPTAGWTQILARLYLTRSKTQVGTRSATYDPYYVGDAEGFDATAGGSESQEVATDPSRPFQAAISLLSPGNEKNVAWFKLNAGDKVGQAWAATYMSPVVPGSTSYPAQLGKKYRRIYNHLVMRWHKDMPAIGLTGKMTFFDGAAETTPGGKLSLASNAPNVIIAPSFTDSLLTTVPLKGYRFNLQGTPDNDLTANVAGVSWAQGVTKFTYDMKRDVWYGIEVIVSASTTAGPGPGGPYKRDGSVQVWMTEYTATNQTWGPPTKLLDAQGLEISSGSTSLPTMGRSYMTKIQRYFQWAGTSQNPTYNGPDTGAYVALDYVAMSEN